MAYPHPIAAQSLHPSPLRTQGVISFLDLMSPQVSPLYAIRSPSSTSRPTSLSDEDNQPEMKEIGSRKLRIRRCLSTIHPITLPSSSTYHRLSPNQPLSADASDEGHPDQLPQPQLAPPTAMSQPPTLNSGTLNLPCFRIGFPPISSRRNIEIATLRCAVTMGLVPPSPLSPGRRRARDYDPPPQCVNLWMLPPSEDRGSVRRVETSTNFDLLCAIRRSQLVLFLPSRSRAVRVQTGCAS